MADVTYRQLGDSGLTVSTIGLGTNNFGMKLDEADSARVLHAAIDAGITLIDTAAGYGASEERIGAALGDKRDQVVLATKFGARGGFGGPPPASWGAKGSRSHIRASVEQSLRRLQTDRIDLLQYHHPDGVTPMEETLAALTEVVREGKVRYLGSSNLKGWQVSDADWIARTKGLERFISAQNSYSLLDRTVEEDLVPAMLHHGVGMLPFFPLASGLLTGKYRRGEAAPEGSRVAAWGMQAQLTDARFEVVEKLEAFAAERGTTLLAVAIGGLAAQPTVGSVIAGATSPEQIEANVAAAAWVPTADDLTALDAIVARGARA